MSSARIALLVTSAFLLAGGVSSSRVPGAPPPAQGDALEKRLREDLAGRPYLKSGWVEVAVEGRKVELRGKVPDELHRRLVVLVCENDPDTARIDDGLSVDPALIPWQPTKEELDFLVMRNANNALRSDRRLGQFKTLTATATRGVVTLRGVVEREEQSRAAERIVLELEHVEKVVNQVEVDRKLSHRAPLADVMSSHETAIAKRVVARVTGDEHLRGTVLMTPILNANRVTLVGLAPDLVRHDHALELAKNELRQTIDPDPERPGLLDWLVPSRRADDPARRAPEKAGSVPHYVVESWLVIGRKLPARPKDEPAPEDRPDESKRRRAGGRGEG